MAGWCEGVADRITRLHSLACELQWTAAGLLVGGRVFTYRPAGLLSKGGGAAGPGHFVLLAKKKQKKVESVEVGRGKWRKVVVGWEGIASRLSPLPPSREIVAYPTPACGPGALLTLQTDLTCSEIAGADVIDRRGARIAGSSGTGCCCGSALPAGAGLFRHE